MESGGRHKAVAPWRFHRRRQVEGGGRFDAKQCGSGTPGSNGGGLTEGIGIAGSESDGGSGDSGFEKPSTGSTDVSEVGGGGGGWAGRDWDQEGFDNGAAAKERNVQGKDYSLDEDFGIRGSRVAGCRNARKAVVPWRFQVGYKRPRSQGSGLGSGSGNHGPSGTTESKFSDNPKQCTPAAGSNYSHIKVSVDSDHSSVKFQKQTVSKKKPNRHTPYQVMPNNKRVAIMPNNKRVATTRESVLVSLQEFRIIYRKLLEQEEAKWREKGHVRNPDMEAFRIFRETLCVVDDDRSNVGTVPGIQIGDTFNSRLEVSVVGLHRQPLTCVDYIKKNNGTCLAVSIVSYVQASTSNNNLEFLLHIGSTAATSEQMIEGTDLALKWSMDTETPIRVIHVVTDQHENGQQKGITNFVYGGLYFIKKFCMEKLKEGQYIPTFQLRRMAGQQHIDIQELLKTRKQQEPFGGVFVADISEGLEKVPVSAINSISNEYPVLFRYISNIRYAPKHQPGLPLGCDCVNGCSYSHNCACVVKNGGEIPFSNKGTITHDKPLVYECGPSCNCPPACHNRVSQHGIKFRLQVFKTKSKGWGVRSLDFIPSGSFVCEYIGELLEDDEAQERKNDEYLFGIGNNYYNVSRWEGMAKIIPSLENGPVEDEESGFAVDALNWGNLARFINHSCTPNLFAQNVLFDHDNISMPHIMFFAGDDIPPLQELSYDYNYEADKVHDSDGNIKKKKCFCRSIECTGWLY